MTSSELYAILTGIFIGFITISILIGIIIKQRQTIKDFQNPKYGFLGKKLSIYALGVTALGVVGFVLYPNNLVTRDDTVSVSDEIYQISIDIVADAIDDEGTYQIILVPSFDGEPWGRTDNGFVVSWDINGEKSYQLISFNNRSGFTTTLEKGENIIRGTIVVEDTALTKEITVEVD